MKPELIIKNPAIDFELCELLGDKPSDFIVLCFDGVELQDFGTPYATKRNLEDRQELIDALNDRSENSLWPEMWSNWKSNICKQFGLSDTTTDKDFRPVVSYKISRVCRGYSEHLHVAIGLFETLAEKITYWSIGNDEGKCMVRIEARSGSIFLHSGKCMSLVIAKTVLQLLRE